MYLWNTLDNWKQEGTPEVSLSELRAWAENKLREFGAGTCEH